ncbi:MAG: hypothetical protein ACXV74_02425 [Methylobacter sp.]
MSYSTRSGIVQQPADWPWGSYRTMVGKAESPAWLETEALAAQFGGLGRASVVLGQRAGRRNPRKPLKSQVYLGG